MSDFKDISFDGDVVAVTGGAMGIGRAICENFAALGADVSIADIALDEAQQTASEVSEEYGVEVVAVETNVKDYDEAANFVETTIDELGGIDVLVNNAGGGDGSPSFLESEPDGWDHIIDLCYKGTMNTMHAALPNMIEQESGVIINFASDFYKGNDPGLGVYGGAKAANVSLTKTVAHEVGEHGVRVNCVSPGSTWTPATEDVLEDHADVMAEKSYALDRLGQPEDIANAVVFFASDAADWVTGRTLSVNGGYIRG
jgi:NAD(P)-dependent dehydrogenase (short-subunit alcohol dehydrogenase family)